MTTNKDINGLFNFNNSLEDTFCPKCCENCSNHPKNGGSGICNCALPYINNPYITWSGDNTNV